MTALLFVDAIDTAGFLLDVVALWVAGLTAAGLLLLLLLGWSVRKAWRAIRNSVTGARRAAHAPCDPEVVETAPEPHTPTWAHTEKETA